MRVQCMEIQYEACTEELVMGFVETEWFPDEHCFWDYFIRNGENDGS